MVSLVVFDIAGTSVTGEDGVSRSFRAALAAVGIETSPDAIQAVRGLPKREALRLLTQRASGVGSLAVSVDEIHVGVTQGTHTREQLEPYPYTHLLESVAELPGALGLRRFEVSLPARACRTWRSRRPEDNSMYGILHGVSLWLALGAGVSDGTLPAAKAPAGVRQACQSRFSGARGIEWKLKPDGNYEAEFSLRGVEIAAQFDPTGHWQETEKSIHPTMRLPALLALILLLGSAAPRPQALFDGKTFNGWEGNRQVFRIQEGAIVGGSTAKGLPHNEFLCTTQTFRDFELRLKFKLIGAEANGGVQIRSRRIPNDPEVSGYQADMGQTYWGCLYDESRRNKVLAAPPPDLIRRILKPNDWNDYRIRCEGQRIRLWLNGTQTVDFTETDAKIPQDGILGLQIHGGPPSEAWYRDIVITPLD